MQIEEWKEIKKCPGYFVSSFGNVMGKRFKHFYKTQLNHKGYEMVRIPRLKYNNTVHRLVAEHFIDTPDKSLQVNHKDGNKSNNHYSNLEYVTCKENINHAIRTGLRTATINLKRNSIFSVVQVMAIKSAIAAGHGNQEISRYFKCDHSTISKIRGGVHYPHV